MTNTNKKKIEGIRFIARDTQKMKVFDKVNYALYGSSAVSSLLDDAHEYQGRYEHEFSVYDSACIDYGKIDIETLKAKARKLAEDNEEIYEDETYYQLFDEMIEKINPPYSVIMEHITEEIGYYHEVQLYDGTEWFDETEIDIIDYDDENFGTFTLKEDEE